MGNIFSCHSESPSEDYEQEFDFSKFNSIMGKFV